MTLFIVGLLNGRHRERGEGWGWGGVLLLILPFTTSSSSPPFFKFFFSSPTTHCCRDKRIKGETLFLPFPISAVFSKSPGRNLLGWKCQATELWMRCRARSCCSWPHFFPKSFSLGWDLSPRGSECPFPGGTTGQQTFCPHSWMGPILSLDRWSSVATAPTYRDIIPRKYQHPGMVTYIPAVSGSWTEALLEGPNFAAKHLLLVPAAQRYFGASPDYWFFLPFNWPLVIPTAAW